MIRINLLPFRAARKKENIRRQISIFFLSFFLVGIALFYYNTGLNSKVQELEIKVKNTRKELQKYNRINKEIASIKKKLAILEKKTDVIKNLELNRRDKVRLLDAMTDMVIAKRMWFTSFGAKAGDVNINGIALDNKTVADFMLRLENSGLFERVKLKSTRQQKYNQKINLKSFVISCHRAPLNKAATNKAIN